MALASSNSQGDLSSSESVMVLDKEADEYENDQDLTTKSSLQQVKSARSLQERQSARVPVPEAEFKPTARLYFAFGTLAVITLMVALDGTSLSVALPVGYLSHPSDLW